MRRMVVAEPPASATAARRRKSPWCAQLSGSSSSAAGSTTSCDIAEASTLRRYVKPVSAFHAAIHARACCRSTGPEFLRGETRTFREIVRCGDDERFGRLAEP